MTIRWGLLGTAHINRRIIPAMRAARRSVVAAVASRDADRIQQYAAEWRVPTAHVGYDALLRDSTVDAVYIPLPNALHVEWTLRALDAGKHVLCEKPLALSADDVDRVAAVARARDRVVAEVFMYRHEPQTARLLELVSNGAVGRVTHMSVVFTYQQQRENDVRLVPALGGGSLWDIGCYATSIMRLLAQAEPEQVFGWAVLGSTGVDESFTGTLRFPGGVTGALHCSFRSSYRTTLDVHGDAGALRVVSPFKPGLREEIELRRGDERTAIVIDGSPLHFVRLVEDFVGAALDGRSPAVSLGESRGNAATLAALHASALTRRPTLV